MSMGRVGLTVAGALSSMDVVPSFCLRQRHGGAGDRFIIVVLAIGLGVFG